MNRFLSNIAPPMHIGVICVGLALLTAIPLRIAPPVAAATTPVSAAAAPAQAPAADTNTPPEPKHKGINGGGTGIQYRSQTGIPWRTQHKGDEHPNLDWMMTGPQADFWSPAFPIATEWTGQFYSENTPLGILAWRGQVVDSAPGKAPQLVGNIGDRTALGGYVKVNNWNEYLIMARGGTFIHVINGQLMAVYVDDDPASSNNKTGMIGIEIEGVPCKVLVRNVWIKKLQ